MAYVFDSLELRKRYDARDALTGTHICFLLLVDESYIVDGYPQLGGYSDPREAVDRYKDHVLAQSATGDTGGIRITRNVR